MRIRTIAAVLLFAGLTGWAIARVPAQAQATQTASLNDVVAELKLLRSAVEVNNKNQALAAAIGLRQSMVQALSTELVSIRRDLDSVGDDIREVNESMSQLGVAVLPREATLQKTRGHLNSKLAGLRAREGDVSQRLKSEEAAAAKLITQLQQNVSR